MRRSYLNAAKPAGISSAPFESAPNNLRFRYNLALT